jgi:hypothetical protein
MPAAVIPVDAVSGSALFFGLDADRTVPAPIALATPKLSIASIHLGTPVSWPARGGST